MSYKYKLDAIIKELNKQNTKTPSLMIIIKDSGDEYYRFMDNNTKNDLFKDLSDEELKELKFRDDAELLDYMSDRAYKVGIPMHQISRYKPLMIEIKDNSYLERYLYNANRE